MSKRVPVVYLSLLDILEFVWGVGTLYKSVGPSFLLSCSFEIHSDSQERRSENSDCQVVQSEKSVKVKVQNDKILNPRLPIATQPQLHQSETIC